MILLNGIPEQRNDLITGNENALNFADMACAIGSATMNTGQTLYSCPTARTKECHDP